MFKITMFNSSNFKLGYKLQLYLQPWLYVNNSERKYMFFPDGYSQITMKCISDGIIRLNVISLQLSKHLLLSTSITLPLTYIGRNHVILLRILFIIPIKSLPNC